MTLHLFRNWILSTLLFSLSTLSLASDEGAAVAGNGGAGVSRNGRLMSFYSAGLYTEPEAVTNPVDVPGINGLITFVRSFQYWSLSERSVLLQKVLPSDSHRYFRVKEKLFDQKTKDRLIAEFSRVTQQPVGSLELFAVTDTKAGVTFLLPGFYRLSLSDQVAILFHENYWLLYPNTTYLQVVSAEMAFQAVYEKPNLAKRVVELLRYYGNENKTLAAMIQADLDSGALNGLLTPGGIPLSELFGDDFFSCAEGDCVPGLIGIHLYSLVQKYPDSLFLNRLLNETVTQSEKKAGLCLDFSKPEYSFLEDLTRTSRFDSYNHGMDNSYRFTHYAKQVGECKLRFAPNEVKIGENGYWGIGLTFALIPIYCDESVTQPVFHLNM